MSQSTEVDTLTLTPDEVLPPDAATLVDTYADQLMDDLFGDVEQILEGNEAAFSAIATSPGSLGRVELEATLTGQDASLEASLQPFGAIAPLETPAESDKPPRRPLTWRQGLLMVTALSALGAAGFWLYQQPWFTLNQPGTPVSAPELPAPTSTHSDAEFLNYLSRSLEVLDGKIEAGKATETSPTLPDVALLPASPSSLPPTLSSLPPLTTPGGSVNVIERVYIPYQTAPAPAVPTAPASVPPTPAPAIATQPSEPVTAHLLVGVLELGNRSAALFEINGVSQRVYIGERIGNSGWSLVSVSSDEAVIRRNGEVRSIYIGQKF